jgi:hypothetical protein
VQVLAATIAAGAMAPPNREFLNSKYVVGAIEVEPPAGEGKPAAAEDPRPSPGEPATFVEQLTDAVMKPQFTEMPPAVPVPAAPAAAVTTPPAPAPPPVPMRIYTIRGIARNGRPGQPATRLQVPLADLPAAPANLAVTFDEKALKLSWTPPVAEGAKPPLFNIYTSTGTQPLNAAPVAAPAYDRAGVEFGKEECFVVRTVQPQGAVQVESAATAPQCVTPADRFPPAIWAAISSCVERRRVTHFSR